MIYVKKIILYSCYIFTVMTLILTFLTYIGLNKDVLLTVSTPYIFLVAITTASFTTLSEKLLSKRTYLAAFVDVLGISCITLAITMWVNQLSFHALKDYILPIVLIVIVIYILVWTLVLLQNHRDVVELNQNLEKFKTNKKS